jgi:hypothetical protein
VDTKACARKMVEIIETNPNFQVLKDTKLIKAEVDGDYIKVH